MGKKEFNVQSSTLVKVEVNGYSLLLAVIHWEKPACPVK